MKLQRPTISLCSTCYREIPALVEVRQEGVTIKKSCAEHGEQQGILEKDSVLYTYLKSLPNQGIYGGHFVDVTRACNLRCQYCYYPLQAKDPEGMFSVARIVEDCRVNAHRAPFILTGGEPTLHPQIVDLIKGVSAVGPVELLTNGVNLAKKELFDEVLPLITNNNGIANLNLSIHPETEKWREVVEACRENKVKIESALIVVDSEDSFHGALELVKSLSDVVLAFRIKAASRIWNEQKPEEKIFVSDMLQWLDDLGGASMVPQRGNKSVIVNVVWKGIFMMLVSWHDITNVDLMDIDCAPWYRARNGQVCNFVTAGLINEGMAKGWLNGERIANP